MDATAGHEPGDGAITGPPVRDLGNEVFEIDTLMGGYSGITAGYLVRGERPALIETGTALSTPTVVAALASLGVQADDLCTVVVTHIHLDHAGGVGDIAAAFPQADVVVHERGARHLADPARLMASAAMVFGDDMTTLFGPLRPVPGERLRSVGELDAIDLGGGRQLRTFHSPGHASHHIGLIDSDTGDLYTGDAAGVFVPETAQVRPATPPPDFDLDLSLASLRHFRDIGPTRLLFSHYGPVEDAISTLEQSEEELRVWVDTVRSARNATADLDHAVAMVHQRMRERQPAYYADADVLAKFETLSSTTANVQGISRWLDRQEADVTP